MNETDVLALLAERGALLRGHFLLTSGRHSDVYVEKARVLERPDDVDRLAAEMAGWYADIDVVVSPAVGAIPLGFAVARAAGARFVFAEREKGVMTLRRGFQVSPGERVLVVEDVITTGGSAGEVHRLVDRLGATSLGVAALVDRSSEPLPFPLRALARVVAVTHDAEECQMCARGMAVESHGSRRL